MSSTLHLLKLGGRVMDDPAQLGRIIDAFLAKPGKKILVHGGGNRATALSTQMGLQPQLVDGRRITDTAALEVAVMVYAGWINKTLVAQLQARGAVALGVSGTDANLILARKRPVGAVDFGWVGDVVSIQVDHWHHLLDLDWLPVVCAITHDGQGQLLNTNADTIASTLATALAPYYTVNLYLCLDKNGVLLDPTDDQSVVPQLSAAQYAQYRASGQISGGMLPKLDNAFAAIEQGVSQIIICGPQSFIDGRGTLIQ